MPRTPLPIRPRAPKPRLTVARVLGWADAFRDARGRWPTGGDGLVPGTAGETWGAVDRALAAGHRGLPGGTTLAQVLLRHRGRPHHGLPPDLTVPQILAWADAHHRRTGGWPGHLDGAIPGTRLTWAAVDTALVRGRRGLPGGTSLARLLERHRGARNHLSAPPLTPAVILGWADDHRRRTGHYPKPADGPVRAAPPETWGAVEIALVKGHRGLPGGDSLARFLARHRGVRNQAAAPPLTVEQIKAWAEAHRARTGGWPTAQSGPVRGAPGESWGAVASALDGGRRGLPGGDGLARLLARACGKRNPAAVPPLALGRIRLWVRLHRAHTGRWPHAQSGPVIGVAGETWGAVANALQKGRRGLPRGTTLARLVGECRGKT
ncbi:hypothetical protein J0H58_38445 [bacterium]|nr:hypothetical protein [bacterium]